MNRFAYSEGKRRKAEGRRWPKEWDVDFKLHAPGNTTVEGVLKIGKLTKLKVTPESRKKDLLIQLSF